MVQPARILTFLLYIGMMSALILLFSPGKLWFSEKMSLKVPTWDDLFFGNSADSVIAEVQSLDQKIDSIAVAVQVEDAPPTVFIEKENPRRVQADFSLTDVRIELPLEKPDALGHFFESLFQVQTTESQFHVLHYGDSQLDGDRVTDYLRHRLQNQFGGCGVGLVPVAENEDIRSTLKQTASANWERHAIYGTNAFRSTHNLYSLMGSYFRFNPNLTASVNFNHSALGYERNNRFEKLQVFYRNPSEKLVLKYSLGDGFGGMDSLPVSSADINSFQLPLSGNLKKGLSIKMESAGTPEVFGFSFDCNRGIAVDNIAFRGSSGTEFTKMDRKLLKAQMEMLNVRLIVVQFGVNVIPNVRSNYRYYENAMYRQLSYLKSLSPETDILVVGVSDMARKEGAGYATYPNLPMVHEAQRQAAFRAGCAYWNLFGAMGGKNAIISWVNRRPPLAQQDYTHFTRRGAKLVGEMLYNELMRLYIPYQKSRMEEEGLGYAGE